MTYSEVEVLILTYFLLSSNSEILRVIDSLQLNSRIPYIVTPTDWVVCVSCFTDIINGNANYTYDLIFSIF